MKALVTASFTTEALNRLSLMMEVVYEDWRSRKRIYFDGAQLAARLRELNADVLIVEADLVHEDALDNAPLKLIGCCRGDPVNIGIARATQLGIPVLYAPGRNADAVADLTLGYMLALARHIYTVNFLLKSGQLRFDDAEGYLAAYETYGGFELGGVAVGVVGFGAIGRRVVARVRAFGSRVLVCDPYVAPQAVMEAGAEPSDLDTLLPQVDFLTLHCPETPENRNLLDATRIRAMKRGAFLINLARAALVDDDAVYAALCDGHLAGAAFDVFREEPVRPENRFVRLPNVLVSPHLGGATRDVLRHQSDLIVDGIEAWFQGRRPAHIANPEVLG